MIKDYTDPIIEKKIKNLTKNIEITKTDFFLKSKKFRKLIHNLELTKKINISELKKIQKKFKKFNKGYLKKLEKLPINAGDLRYNSFTLFLITSLIKPESIIETGVANGKSTTNFLYAISESKNSKLISIDKYENNPKKLALGRKKGRALPWSYNKLKPGYLIPRSLKKKWKLYIGDSFKVLKKLKAKGFKRPDIFFHDSLHSKKHTFNEIKIILSMKSDKETFLIIDDVDKGSGLAFKEILKKNNITGYVFKNLGFVKLEGNKKYKC